MTANPDDGLNRRASFFKGMRQSIPAAFASAPFGFLFGTIAVQNGLSIGEATLMSAALYAGASQLVGLDLFGHKVAPWIIVLSIFAVNFRHVLYSAAIGRRVAHWSGAQRYFGFFFLTDPQYADGERQAIANGLGFSWYMGYATLLYLCWISEAAIGATFGDLVANPHALGLDFVLPIYFVGMVMGFRRRPLWLPVVAISAAASTVAYFTVGSPWHVSIGGMAGVLLAAMMTPTRARSA